MRVLYTHTSSYNGACTGTQPCYLRLFPKNHTVTWYPKGSRGGTVLNLYPQCTWFELWDGPAVVLSLSWQKQE
jgi:hypothetical protein